MLKKQNHSIQKFRIELMLENEKNAFRIEQRFLSAVKEAVRIKLEELFNEIAGDQRYIKISKLEIDAGLLFETDLEQGVTNQLPALIREELKKSVSVKYQSTKHDLTDTVSAGDNSSNTQILNKTQYIYSWFTYFLKHGRFPWWSPRVDFDSFEKEIITLFYTESKEVSDRLKTILSQNKNVTDRLCMQFTEDFLVEVISLLMPDKKELIFETIRGLIMISHEKKISAETGQAKINIYPLIFNSLSWLDYTINSPRNWIKQVVDNFLQLQKKHTDREQVLKLLLTHFKKTNNSDLQKELTRAVISILTEKSTITADQETNHDEPPPFKEKFDSAKYNKYQSEKYKNGTQKKKFDTISDIENSTQSFTGLSHQGEDYTHKQMANNDEAIDYYISNSGLVILSPFLNAFFKELELLKYENFINKSAQNRAVHILQYAANKKERSPENELVLNKILCNIPINEPIMRDIILTDKEKNSVSELLNAVINHWSELKGTSEDGLREGFLMRDGKLSIVNECWKLTIERKTLDVLLSHIPWGFSMIKLPWMNSLVSVEW